MDAPVYQEYHVDSKVAASQIRQYIKQLWTQDPTNARDICDAFDLCTQGVEIERWHVDPYNSKRLSIRLARPIVSQFLYKNMPIHFEIKKQVDVIFAENGTAKQMFFLDGALKGTKLIDLYIAKVEFNNAKGIAADQKNVTLQLDFFLGSKTVVWKLAKLQSILQTIHWP